MQPTLSVQVGGDIGIDRWIREAKALELADRQGMRPWERPLPAVVSSASLTMLACPLPASPQAISAASLA